VAAMSAGVLVIVVAFLWFSLPAHVRAEFGWFQRITLLAFFLAVVVLLYGVFRTRVAASERGIAVTNGFRRYEFAWAEVVAISLTQHRPWALLDLTDGTTTSVMALQSSDGSRATRSARELAGLIAARSATDRDD
jgi:hypothetical protein